MSITASEARRDLFPLIEQVNDDRTVVEIVSRRGDGGSGVRRLVCHTQGWEDFSYWALNDRATTTRVLRPITEALRDLFSGIGKPEPLKHSMPGAWSRRITDEHASSTLSPIRTS